MATSGIYSFNLNKLQIITKALQLINIVQENGVIPNDNIANNASDTLNMMIKSWETDGIHLWKRKQATLFPQYNQASYQVGSVTGADNVTNTFYNTTLSSANAINDTILTVNSITGFTVGMNIGIELDDQTRQWTVISSINTLNKTITVNTALTTTAAIGNTVVAYSSLINRPLKIIRGTICDLKNNNNENPINKIGFDEYFDFPSKTTLGIPTNFYYDTVLSNALPYTSTLYMYPTPNLVYKVFKFTYLDSIQDMLNNTDDADFPQEWLMPLIYNLATELAYSYGKFAELQRLQPKADLLKMTIKNFDGDDETLKISLDWSYIKR